MTDYEYLKEINPSRERLDELGRQGWHLDDVFLDAQNRECWIFSRSRQRYETKDEQPSSSHRLGWVR